MLPLVLLQYCEFSAPLRAYVMRVLLCTLTAQGAIMRRFSLVFCIPFSWVFVDGCRLWCRGVRWGKNGVKFHALG